MTNRSKVSVGVAATLIASAAVVTATYRWRATAKPEPVVEKLPQPGSKTYVEMVSAFYSGVAALEVDANERAKASLTRATELVPGEPAAWANRGLLNLRLGDHAAAAHELEKARTLSPESGAIEGLLGLLESRRGNFAESIAHFQRAVELDPADLKSRFSLVHEVERQGEPDSEVEALRLAALLVEKQPENLVVLLEHARLAAKGGDAQALGASVVRLGRLVPSWPTKAQEMYGELEREAKSNPRSAARRVLFLRNVLVQTPTFRKNLAAVETPLAVVGDPITQFLRLAPPAPTPSPPDETTSFFVQPIETNGAARSETLVAVPLLAGEPPVIFVADGQSVRRLGVVQTVLPFPGGPSSPPGPHGILAVDWNSDYRMDFVFAGAMGLKIYEQKADQAFADVSAATNLGAGVLSAKCHGVWAADIEMDGDLDFVVGSPGDAKVTVLRNNGDGTFGSMQPFEGATDLRDFVWADLDQDGDPDAALLDSRGTVRVYTNERAGRFQLRRGPEGAGTILALAVTDVNGDGKTDLLLLKEGGTIVRATDGQEGDTWKVTDVTSASESLEGPARLFVADMDNNGAVDLIVSGKTGGSIVLGDDSRRYRTLPFQTGLQVLDVVDIDGDGRLDLLTLSAEGRPTIGNGQGKKAYHWQVVRPRGAQVFGDGRINSFGLGGEIEVRAGVLVQKQVINGPVVHFGLGDRAKSDVVRVVWPNGTVQAEFDAEADHAVAALQRLKGSCPFLFAFDGTAMRFVTDFIWRSPLGLRINAQDTAGVAQTEDWVKVRGDQLAPRQGVYDVRITAELWETHYFDHVSLMVVDHPKGTEVFVDERFARQSPPLVVHPMGLLHPVAYARDDQGRDVLEEVATRDGRFLDGFGRGFYQGVTRDHWVEVELGDEVPRDRPLWLVAHGWIHPTDSSINVAIGQGKTARPQGLVVEIPTADGNWSVAQRDLGFPAGKNKTILVDLNGMFRSGGLRRLRLRTNLEVFWDSLAVAEAAPETTIQTQRLAPSSAELRPRGYSLLTQANASSPELPQYDSITATGQRWRDLIGYYTRFGDVGELLKQVDDRYVIANAGDELALRFPAPAPPPEGWVRDFIMIGDGWNKDGDYNTAFSKTVLPLPSHRRPSYDVPPGSLEDDPVYRFHPDDWREYHTRYVTSGEFQRGLRPRLDARPRHESE